MKRTLFRISSSGLQRQRGMVRVTLLTFTAAVMTGGAIAVHRVGHPVVKSITQHIGGCGCSALYAATSTPQPSPPLVGYWSPPASSYSRREIAALPSVLLLKAGASLPIKALVWNKKLGPKAAWSATYGVVDAAGDYTAPPYTPQRGDDILTLSDPGNVFITGTKVRIHILPNPAIPGSAKTPYINHFPVGTTGYHGLILTKACFAAWHGLYSNAVSEKPPRSF